MLDCDRDLLAHKAVDAQQQGCTMCLLLIQPLPGADLRQLTYRLTVANLGDSRLLLLDAQGRLVFQTLDHKPEHPLERARIERAGGFVAQARVDHVLALSRALGDGQFKRRADLPPPQQKVSCEPDLLELPVYSGFTLVMFCDGLVEALSNLQVAEFVAAHLRAASPLQPFDAGRVCSELVDYGIVAGSRDNISVLIMHLGDGSDYNHAPERYAPTLAQIQQRFRGSAAASP